MSGANEDEALKVAEAISDGVPIDWDALLLRHTGLRDTLDELKALERIARAHGHPVSPLPIDPTLADTLPLDRSREHEPTRGPATWGTLRILDRLGEGGFGVVYRAHDPSLQRDVALKLWRVEDSSGKAVTQRMLDEARQLARVRHGNVIVVHGAAEHEGRPGLWTELLHGRTLEEHLAEQGPLSAHEAALIGLDLCRALAAVHAAGLVHRDVKTQNVMREQGGRIVLMDFSAAAGTEPGREAQSLGTPLTMAPEQLKGGPTTAATDMYGLGVLLYRLVTNRYPIEARSLAELHAAHDRRAMRPLRDVRSDLPMEFVQVVERALSPDPDRRFASAGAMERALAAVVGGQSSPPVIPTPEPARARRRDWRLAVAVALLAVVLVALVGRNALRRPADGVPTPGLRTTAPRPPLSVSARLFRRAGDAEERLLPGARVAPGDALFMELQSSDTVHVYVLNEDSAGEVYALFPAPSFDRTNPLPSGTHQLPGTIRGQRASWQVTSAGGRENVIVVASRRRLPDIEADIAALAPASPDRPVSYARLSTKSLGVLRGMGGVRVDPLPPRGSGGTLAGILDSLPSGATATGDVWAWTFELENPRR